jgi:tetratricopeptide (TPR) repeat protein
MVFWPNAAALLHRWRGQQTQSIVRAYSAAQAAEAATRSESLLMSAEDACRRSDMEKARAQWEEAYALWPDPVLLAPCTVIILSHFGRLEELESLLQQGRKRHPTLPHILSGLARIAESKQDFPEALKLWTTLQKRSPTDLTAWTAAVECLKQMGRQKEGGELLLSAQKYLSENWLYLIALAQVMEEIDQPARAIAAWDKLGSDHELVDGYVGAARVCRRSGNIAEAESRLTAVREKFPYDPSLLAEVARLREGQGRWDEAARAWADMRLAHPSLELGYREGVRCFEEAGQVESAIALRHQMTSKF